mmetsp:Transcript_14578/g.16698  ORF Transcript_14578/g.16698 Transcript_14578/m.16698 type:complete len:175 (-) Transcript_14578:121-645(-)
MKCFVFFVACSLLLLGVIDAFTAPIAATRAIGKPAPKAAAAKPAPKAKPAAKAAFKKPVKKVAAAKKPVAKATKAKAAPKKAVPKKAAPKKTFAKKAAPAKKVASKKTVAKTATTIKPAPKKPARKPGSKAPVLAFGLLDGKTKLGYYPKLDPKKYYPAGRVKRNPYQNNAPIR